MRRCTKCGETKPFSDFNRNRGIPGGYTTICKACRNAWYRKRYEIVPEKFKTRVARYYANNIEKLRDKDRARAPERKASKAHWARKNAARCAAKVATRDALKLKATPPWLTPQDRARIADFYKEARRRTKQTGIKHSVDHIIPLRGKTVCGLHVPWNLQVLTATENTAKGNRL